MQPTGTTPSIHKSVQDLRRKQRIAQAVALGDCGHIHKAMAMVECVPASARHAEDWDLMARLYTSMSRFREARDAWEQAERAGMSPELVRKVITALDARRHITLIAIVLLVTAAALAALLALMAILSVLF